MVDQSTHFLLDEEGENLALRAFLAQYSCDRVGTVGAMLAHMSRSGWREAAPAFALKVRPETALTKAGAQNWIRHLLSLESAAPSPASTAGGERQSIDSPEFRALITKCVNDLFDGKGVGAVDSLIAHIDTWAARSAGAPVLWFKRLTGAECKPDGRCYDVAFSPMPGYEPLYSGASSAGDAVPAGFKFVPKEPTPAMLDAARNAPLPMVMLDSMSAQKNLYITAQYKAMLGAAPAPGNTEKPAHFDSMDHDQLNKLGQHQKGEPA